MARNEQLIRQHKILQILERVRFGRTLEELRDDLLDELGLTSLHPRSVRRDLEALQASGVDVAAHDSPRGRIWKLGPNFRGTHKISASATELIALSLGRDLLYPLSGTPFWVGIESFWSKMRESLPTAVWDHYMKYRQVLRVQGTPAKSYKQQEGIIKTINRAIRQHRVVRIMYQSLSADQPHARDIEPYAVVMYQSSLYIVAGIHSPTSETEAPPARPAEESENTFRHLKLDRFRRAEALDVYFKPQADFNIERHLEQRLGIFAGGKPKKFRIRISKYAAPWVQEDPWHPDQQIEVRRDGSLILTVTAAHDLEIIPRVMALGAEAEVLSPASCRKTIAETVRQLAETYRND